MHYISCRLFSDVYNAITFTRAHCEATVYSSNRWAEVATRLVETAFPVILLEQQD